MAKRIIAFLLMAMLLSGMPLAMAETNVMDVTARDVVLNRMTDSLGIHKDGYTYYQLIDSENPSEAVTIIRLFPDGIFCMDTALWHYGYSDRTPSRWHIAVDKYSNRSRFNIDYPFVKAYFVAPEVLSIGLCEQEIDGITVKMYDKERVICDCLRYRNKMDKELFNKAIQGYVSDTSRNIPNLMEYAVPLRCANIVKRLIGVWL